MRTNKCVYKVHMYTYLYVHYMRKNECVYKVHMYMYMYMYTCMYRVCMILILAERDNGCSQRAAAQNKDPLSPGTAADPGGDLSRRARGPQKCVCVFVECVCEGV